MVSKKHAKVELLTIEKFNLQNKDLPSKKIEDEHNEQRKPENKQLGSVEWKKYCIKYDWLFKL